jgi:hypothetical protein
MPSGRFPSLRNEPTGSNLDGTSAEARDRFYVVVDGSVTNLTISWLMAAKTVNA